MKILSETFQLNGHPFQEHAKIVLLDHRFKAGLQQCRYFTEYGLVGLLQGPTGVGKTCMMHQWINKLPTPQYWPLYLPLCSVNSTAMLRMINAKLGEQPSMGKDRLMLQIVRKIEHSERQVILVLDEAHLLNQETLTDLRVLLGMPQVKKHTPLKLFLCAQPPLESILKSEALADLANRISIRIGLHALTPQQTCDYIDQRLKHCGCTVELFDASAKEMIHNCTGGIPRQINQLATMTLLHAANQSVACIDQAVVSAAAGELRYL